MALNIGAAIGGGMLGYKYAQDMKDQQADFARKKKADDDIAKKEAYDQAVASGYPGIGAPQQAVQPAQQPAAQSAGIDGGITAEQYATQPTASVAQGIAAPPQSQPPSWDDRRKWLEKKESEGRALPGGMGAGSQQTFAKIKADLLNERLPPMPKDGVITPGFQKEYIDTYAKVSQELGATITPDMVEKISTIQKTIKKEGIDKAVEAAASGDPETANKHGATGEMNWNLQNKREVTNKDGTKSWEYDNLQKDGTVAKVNMSDYQKKLLGIEAQSKMAMEAKKAEADTITANAHKVAADAAMVTAKNAIARAENDGVKADIYSRVKAAGEALTGNIAQQKVNAGEISKENSLLQTTFDETGKPSAREPILRRIKDLEDEQKSLGRFSGHISASLDNYSKTGKYEEVALPEAKPSQQDVTVGGVVIGTASTPEEAKALAVAHAAKNKLATTKNIKELPPLRDMPVGAAHTPEGIAKENTDKAAAKAKTKEAVDLAKDAKARIARGFKPDATQAAYAMQAEKLVPGTLSARELEVVQGALARK